MTDKGQAMTTPTTAEERADWWYEETDSQQEFGQYFVRQNDGIKTVRFGPMPLVEAVAVASRLNEYKADLQQAEAQLAKAVGLLRKVPCYSRVTDSEPSGVTMSPVFGCGNCDRCTFLKRIEEKAQ